MHEEHQQQIEPQLEHEHEYSEEVVSNKFEYFKLGVIFLLIGAGAFFLNQIFGSDRSDELMRWFMGLFFVTFGTFKFIGYEMFTEMFPSYNIIAARSRIYTYSYPFIELLLGSLYLVNAIPVLRDITTLALCSVSAYGIYKTIKIRGNIQCACLGNIVRLPLSAVSLVENLLMAVMAFLMLIL